MSWERLAETTVKAAQRGEAKVTTRGRYFTVRFGIDPDRCVRRYDDEKDTWLVVRRVYEIGEWRWERTGLSGNTNRLCARVKSRPRLEGIIRSMCQGVWSRGGGSYIEVLPWREDDQYPAPKPYAEVVEEEGWEC